MHEWMPVILNLLTLAAMLFGLFFLVVGVLGLWRLPDFYNRCHAASKCVTLGISGLLVAAAAHLAVLPGANPVEIVTKVVLVTVFLFIAAPVGAHLLARAAHLDGAPLYEGTAGDELEQDEQRQSK